MKKYVKLKTTMSFFGVGNTLHEAAAEAIDNCEMSVDEYTIVSTDWRRNEKGKIEYVVIVTFEGKYDTEEEVNTDFKASGCTWTVMDFWRLDYAEEGCLKIVSKDPSWSGEPIILGWEAGERVVNRSGIRLRCVTGREEYAAAYGVDAWEDFDWAVTGWIMANYDSASINTADDEAPSTIL